MTDALAFVSLWTISQMKPRRDNPLALTTTRCGGTSAKSDREPGFAIHVAWRQRLPSSPHFSSVRIATKRTPP
jgi:hypothetical protein